MHVHCAPVGEVFDHPFHEPAEATVAQRLVVEDYQQGCHQIAHALHVAHVQVFPDVAEGNYIV